MLLIRFVHKVICEIEKILIFKCANILYFCKYNFYLFYVFQVFHCSRHNVNYLPRIRKHLKPVLKLIHPFSFIFN